MASKSQLLLFEDEHPDAQATRALLDDLLSKSRLFRTTDSYRKLLDFVVRLRNFAPFNAMLLQLQKPGLTYAASAYDWETRFRRLVKDNARPLLILWPFAPVATVYDVLDTYDPKNPDGELPSEIASFFAAGSITREKMDTFKSRLARIEIGLEWFDGGDGNAGLIRSGTSDSGQHYLVNLNRNHNPDVQFSTLAHELGHLCLGHLGPNKKLNIPDRRTMTHAAEEIEAESVAYLVCERNGVHTNSEKYLHHFVRSGVTGEDLELYAIMKAAGKVEELLDLQMRTKFSR